MAKKFIALDISGAGDLSTEELAAKIHEKLRQWVAENKEQAGQGDIEANETDQ